MTESVLEIVEFRASGDSSTLITAAAAMQTWLDQQPGFHWRRLAMLGDGQFIDCIEWQDMESAKNAAANIMSAPTAGAFMAHIDGRSVNMRHAMISVA